MIIGKVLAQRALITPDREAMIAGDRILTFDELNRRTNRLANTLLNRGVKPGERIGVLMFNGNEFIETYFAAARLGAVLVPLNTRLAAPELDYILNDCEVAYFIFGLAFEDKVHEMTYPLKTRLRVSTGPSSVADTLPYENLLREAPEKEIQVGVDENDLLVIMYTSGTTGYPKGAMLSHGAMYSAGVDIQIGLHYSYPDRCLLLAPFFHSGAISPFLGHLIRGISTVVMETFDPEGALRLIGEKGIQHMVGVTTIMKMLLQVPDLDAYDLSSWKMAFLPGSPLSYALIKESYDRLGVLCQNMWGLTELCGPGSVMNEEDILNKPESAGKPYFNVDIRIVDEKGRDVSPGEMGEIIARGPNMMMGYWNRPEATRETIRDGWLYTGDSGKFDQEGYLYVVDRIKDMIISGGENIYPAEIEKVIEEISGAGSVSVIGRPDKKWGEVPVAFIEKSSKPLPTAAGIIGHCRSKLAGYKVPKVIEYIDELPRTPSGKVLKRDLRKLVQE